MFYFYIYGINVQRLDNRKKLNTSTVKVRAAVEQVDEALDSSNQLDLLTALQLSSLALRGLCRDNGPWYLDQLLADRQLKALVNPTHSEY